MNLLALPCIFFLVAASMGMCWGQSSIQILDQSGNPVQLNNMPTQVLNLQQGRIYTGQVNEPTTVAGNVENLFTSVGNDGITKFQFGVAQYPTQLIVGTGQNTETFLIVPQKDDGLPYFGTWQNLALIIVAVLLIVVVLTKLAKRGGRSNWR